MIRMQFDGSSTAEAVNQCSRAVEKLSAYVPVTSLEVAATHPNQPPVEVPPAAQVAKMSSQQTQCIFFNANLTVFQPVSLLSHTRSKTKRSTVVVTFSLEHG